MALNIRCNNTYSENKNLDNIRSPPKLLFCEPCTEYEVFQRIMTLNDKKSNRNENIPVKFLKMTAVCISLMLSILFNKCIQKGIFLSKLTVAKVTPLFKSGYSYKIIYYRSISTYLLSQKYLKKISVID